MRHAEARLATGGAFLDFQYHVLAEDRQASALKFDGYLLGFEKSHRELIGFESPWLSCSFFNTYKSRELIFNESGLDYKPELIRDYPAWVNFACKRLDDRSRIFLSHVVRFAVETEPIVNIVPRVIFSAYPTTNQGVAPVPSLLQCDELPLTSDANAARCRYLANIYWLAWYYLTKEFNLELATRLKGGNFTHVIVASMGWNTNELETIQNFNSLIGYTFEAARADGFTVAGGAPFRPLFIGMAWPSAWTFRTSDIAALQRAASVINKGYDADELGMTWYGALLNVALRDAVQRTSTPATRPTIVVLGHSYGARALSHAVAACPFFGKLDVAQCQAAPGADIVIGLQGAFNRSRFLTPREDEHAADGAIDLYIYRDGAPFQRYDVLMGHGTRHFYLWSAYDGATRNLNLIGGSGGVCDFAQRHSEQFKVLPCERTVDQIFQGAASAALADQEAIAREACALAAGAGGCAASGPAQSGAPLFVTDPAHALLIDASGVVHNETPLHGGGAHSDIYKWQIGTVLWQIIHANSRTSKLPEVPRGP